MMKSRLAMMRHEMARRGDMFMHRLMRKLPRRLIYYATLNLIVAGTTGKYGQTNPHDLNVMDALKRFAEINRLYR